MPEKEASDLDIDVEYDTDHHAAILHEYLVHLTGLDPMLDHRRQRRTVYARRFAAVVAYCVGLSISEIAQQICGIDHSTVVHHLRHTDDDLKRLAATVAQAFIRQPQWVPTEDQLELQRLYWLLVMRLATEQRSRYRREEEAEEENK